MPSVADQLRPALPEDPASRRAAALALGAELLARFMARHGLTRAEAIRRLRRNAQRGRTPCSFLDEP